MFTNPHGDRREKPGLKPEWCPRVNYDRDTPKGPPPDSRWSSGSGLAHNEKKQSTGGRSYRVKHAVSGLPAPTTHSPWRVA